MTPEETAGPAAAAGRSDPAHRRWLLEDAARQLRFFDASLRADGGFDLLDQAGRALPRAGQPLHVTTRMVHCHTLAHLLGHPGAERFVEAGLAFLWRHHRDPVHGGYVWAADAGGIRDGQKLAYGHVFVLLAAASARQIGHPAADRLLDDITEVIETRFWDDEAGLLREEFHRDWAPLSDYRGMNANMHGVEAMLALHEATGAAPWLDRAGRVLAFLTARMAPAHGWRVPEHYTADWQVDPVYEGDPMFRPRGTTPGHSLELARLVLQHWDLSGRPATDAPLRARRLSEQALADGWLPAGGLAYTLDQGRVARANRYWWPVAEGIGALASLGKAGPTPEEAARDGIWYRRLWAFAATHLIDPVQGGWFPEAGPDGRPVEAQFTGKPDLYHSLQAVLLALVPGLSRLHDDLRASGLRLPPALPGNTPA